MGLENRPNLKGLNDDNSDPYLIYEGFVFFMTKKYTHRWTITRCAVTLLVNYRFRKKTC